MSAGAFTITTTARPEAFALRAPTLAPSDDQSNVSTVSKHRDGYIRADAVMTAFEQQMTAATDAVGTNTPHAERILKAGRLVSWGVGAVTFTGIAAAGFFQWDFGWFGSLLAGAAAAAPVIGIGRGVSNGVSAKVDSAHARTPLGGPKLDGVRALARGEDDPIGIAALAIAARQWTDIITQREIHGWEAGEILGELSLRTKNVSSTDFGRVTRWSEVRSVLADYAESSSTDDKQLDKLYEALTALRPDERHELAPIVLEKLFDDENPRAPGWSFTQSYELYEYLRTTAERDPADAPPDPRVVRAKRETEEADSKRKKRNRGKKDDEASTETAETILAIQKVTARPSADVEHSNTIASLDATLAAFEAELTMLKGKKQVTADLAAKAIAIATSPERTPVETVALGLRAKRFIGELDAKEIYGYDVRQQMQRLASTGAEIGPALGDQIRRIDAFFAVLKSFSPKRRIDSDEVDRIIACVDELLPCDRRVGAERALACYFDNAAPRAQMEYPDSQRLGSALRAHLR